METADGFGGGGRAIGRRALVRAGLLLPLAGCSAAYRPSPVTHAMLADTADRAWLTLADGTRLPWRQWLPPGPPSRVVLALHGFNDSADGWDLPARVMAAAGVAVVAPDQRGFGLAPMRGQWPGTAQLVADARAMVHWVRQHFPGCPVFVMGESMGGAIAMCLAAAPDPPAIAGYVFSAPAVWGWTQMNLFLRTSLWLANGLVPGMRLGSGPVRVRASDNLEALIALSRDPATILHTRVAALAGLVDLMQAALDAAGSIRSRALYLYGGKDELIPKPAMRAAFRAATADPAARFAYYPNGYHLLLRDQDRLTRIRDSLAWMAAPSAPLPSGAEGAADRFMAGHWHHGLSLGAESG